MAFVVAAEYYDDGHEICDHNCGYFLNHTDALAFANDLSMLDHIGHTYVMPCPDSQWVDHIAATLWSAMELPVVRRVARRTPAG